MNSRLYLGYLTERYNPSDFLPLTLEEIAKDFIKIHKEKGIEVYTRPIGFMTYELKGDAAICYDIYVTKEARKDPRHSWDLWLFFKDQAEKANKQVMIGFSEKNGKNHAMGKRVLDYVGFKPMQESNIASVYFRGV